MPRLPEILNRDELPEDKREVYDYLASTRGSVRIPFSIILNSPEAANRISHLGTYLRFESSIPKGAMELATLAVAREFDCRHEWAMHVGFAKEAGVSDAAIEAVATRGSLSELPGEESLPVRYARSIIRRNEVPDQLFEQAQRRYGDQGVIDLTATVGYYAMMATLLNALQVIPPESLPQLPMTPGRK